MAKTDYLLQVEVERVLALLTPANRVAVRVELHKGLRIGDVLALRKSDIDKGLQWWVTEQKTGKRRRVSVPRDLWRDMQSVCGEEWVFPARCDEKRHRTRQAVWKDMKRAEKALRLSVNVGTHSARKVYAVQLMEKYGDIERVRKALNHGSLNVTMLYALADQMTLRKYAGASKSRKRSCIPS
jgi:integrase